MLVTPKPLTPEQITALDKLKNRPTYYEAEVVHPDGRRVLLCYTPRKTKDGLADAVRVRGVAITAFLGVDPKTTRFSKTRNKVELKIGRAVVQFTGRTRRDVIMEDTPLVGVSTFAPTA